MNDTTETQTPKVNPLLEKIRIPGETIRLPSGGIFYKNGELDTDVTNGEVHIHPMTTIDELTLKSPDKLFSGDAVKEVLGRCAPSILKPLELLSKDVDYILTCLRKLSYGPNIEVKWTHTCTDAKEHPYNIDLGKLISDSKEIDPTTVISSFSTTLKNGQNVTFQPPRFNDVVMLYQAFDSTNTDTAEIQKQVIKSIASTVADVDGITDSNMIEEWLTKSPVTYVHELNDAIGRIGDWGPTFEVEVECKDCGEKLNISTPINPIAFFT